MIAISAAAGAGAAAIGWFALDGGRAVQARTEALISRARVLASRLGSASAPGPAATPVVMGPPLLLLASGPGAVPEPKIQLQGLAISDRGRAALLAIDATPAQWLRVGETRDGVTLIEVGPTRAVVDTAVAQQEVPLWNPVLVKGGGGPPASAEPRP